MEFSLIIRQIAVTALPILFAVTLHEVSHGLVAYRLGDPTAKIAGRLTLNPVSHIDIFGTILMPIMLYMFTDGRFVFGYAKPVPINPYNFKNPRRGMAIAAAGGPAMNILLVIISVVLLKLMIISASAFASDAIAESIIKPVILMLTASISINLILAIFNMLPIPPLDGGRVIVGLLPHKQAMALSKVEPYGMIIVILLAATGIAGYIISPFLQLFISLIGLI